MGRKATGGAFEAHGKHYARIKIGGLRKAVHMPGVTDETAARSRAAQLSEGVTMLEKHELHDLVDRFVKTLAGAAPAEVPIVIRLAMGACEGSVKKDPLALLDVSKGAMQLRELNALWNSNDLAKRHPDYIKQKKRPRDEQFLFNRHFDPVIGHIPVNKFALADAKNAMSSLASHLSPASRQRMAQMLQRLLAIATWPLELIPASPIPKGFVPKRGRRIGLAVLWPDEEEKLLACTEVPMVRRLIYGFADREGVRQGEAGDLRWGQLDMERGIITVDRNKENKPKEWDLRPDVLRALTLWRDRYWPTSKPDDYVFRWKNGEPLAVDHLAERFRKDLKLAGVTRAALFETTEERHQLRFHDTRAFFVCSSLLEGRDITWISDRTGHGDEKMVALYRRATDQWRRLGVSPAPLDLAIPELAFLSKQATTPGNSGNASDETREIKLQDADPEPRHQCGDLATEVAKTAGDRAPEAPTATSAAPPLAPSLAETANNPNTVSDSANGLRHALEAAVKRGDLVTARVLLDELERLEAEAKRAARGADVVSIDAARKGPKR